MSDIPSPEQAFYQEDLRRRLQTARHTRREEEADRREARVEATQDIGKEVDAVLGFYREQERVAADVDELIRRIGVDAERTQRSEPDRMRQNALRTRGPGIDRRSRVPGRISVETHPITRVETTYSAPVEVARDGDSPIFAVFSIKREVIPTGRRKHVSDDPGVLGRIVGTGLEFFEGHVPSGGPALPGEEVHYSPTPDLGPFESNMPIARERPRRPDKEGGGLDAYAILSEFSPRYRRASTPEETRGNLLHAAAHRYAEEGAVLDEIRITANIVTANLDAQAAAAAEAARIAALPPAPPAAPPAPPVAPAPPTTY